MPRDRQLERLLNLAKDDAEILAVLLFGSVARGEASPDSDVDVCLVLTSNHRSPGQLSGKRLAYLKDVDLDVQVFQQLPVYIRQRVLKEGRVLFVRDEDALYDLAFRTIQAFEDFRPYYRTYLAEVARAGS